MTCMKCRLRRIYYRILGALLMPVRSLVGGIQIEDQVIATLYDPKTGKALRHIVGPKMHNKWSTSSGEGLDLVIDCLYEGAFGADELEMKKMDLGSACSDTSFTLISGTEQNTTNEKLSTTQVKATSEWASAGAISSICQVRLKIWDPSTGGLNRSAALYNFGTAFDKPDGVSLKIEWTVTLSNP